MKDDIEGEGRAAAKGELRDEICSGVTDEHPTFLDQKRTMG
jgi:hypothetical protein